MLRTGFIVNDLLIFKQIAKEFPRTAGRIMEPTVMYNDERMEKIRGWMLRSDTFHSISEHQGVYDINDSIADYECKDGMLNIMVNINGRREAIECDKPGQNISIAVGDGGYIHQGSIQCPDCNEVCSNCLAPNEVVQRTAKVITSLAILDQRQS